MNSNQLKSHLRSKVLRSSELSRTSCCDARRPSASSMVFSSSDSLELDFASSSKPKDCSKAFSSIEAKSEMASRICWIFESVSSTSST